VATKNHTRSKTGGTLADVAGALGPHLVDSTLQRSALEEALQAAEGGAALRVAVVDALKAAQIQIIDDVPERVHDVVGPGEPIDGRPTTASHNQDVEHLREIGRRRLALDRGVRSTRIANFLLTAEEEVGLTLLARPDGAMLDPGGFAELTGQARAAADAMFMHNVRLAHSVAQGYLGQGLEYDDLVQSAMLGLIRAVERFDPFSGFKFSTYATWWLRQSVTRAIANEGRLIRIPVHMWEVVRRVMSIKEGLTAAGEPSTVWHLAQACSLPTDKVLECLRLAPGVVSLETPLGDDQFTLGDLVDAQADMPEHVEVHGLFPEDVERLLSDLELREAEVLRMRFALAPYDAQLTLDEIGKIYGVTRERIRQVESNAMEQIRAQLNLEGHSLQVSKKGRRRRARRLAHASDELATSA
jgi:RNA polymerase primary sigma factor